MRLDVWKHRFRNVMQPSSLALGVAFVIGGVLLLGFGEDPIAAYSAMLRGAFGSRFAIGETLARAAPLALVGFGAAVAEWLVDQRGSFSGRLIRFATPDEFLHESGEQEHARKLLGLTGKQIASSLLDLCDK